MGALPKAVVFTALALAASASAFSQTPPGNVKKAPAVRQIPGLTAPDKFPQGCVDCHVNMPQEKMDVRLSTLMRQWQEEVEPALLEKAKRYAPPGLTLKGKHPKLAQGVGEAPKSCLTCHSRSSKIAPPFSRLVHGLHLVGGEANHFMTLFQGECTHCHKLDGETGIWSVKSGKERG
jgi:hypothetical protein